TLPPSKRKYLTRTAFENAQGALKKDIDAVVSFAKKQGLKIVEKSRAKRSVVVSGKMSAFERALKVVFTMNQMNGNLYRSYKNPVKLASSLLKSVSAVLGLDTRAIMEHHAFGHSASHEHTAPQTVASAYGFPAKENGKGQRIAIIELGGGFYE